MQLRRKRLDNCWKLPILLKLLKLKNSDHGRRFCRMNPESSLKRGILVVILMHSKENKTISFYWSAAKITDHNNCNGTHEAKLNFCGGGPVSAIFPLTPDISTLVSIFNGINWLIKKSMRTKKQRHLLQFVYQ